jgi:hypothetical protein
MRVSCICRGQGASAQPGRRRTAAAIAPHAAGKRPRRTPEAPVAGQREPPRAIERRAPMDREIAVGTTAGSLSAKAVLEGFLNFGERASDTRPPHLPFPHSIDRFITVYGARADPKARKPCLATIRLPTGDFRSQHFRSVLPHVLGENRGTVESDHFGTAGTQPARSLDITPRCLR